MKDRYSDRRYTSRLRRAQATTTRPSRRDGRRIGVYAEPVPAAGQATRAESEHFLLAVIKAVHADVDMHLLRVIGIRPLRGTEVGHTLERDAWSIGRISDHDPVLVVL